MSTATFSLVIEALGEDPHGSAPKTLKALRGLDERFSLGDVKKLAIAIAQRLPCTVAMGFDEQRARAVVDAMNASGGKASMSPDRQAIPLVAAHFD